MAIKILDTTLRDGEQTPGVLFSLTEKISIAILLDKAGVHYIEAGTPVNGPAEQTAIKAIIDLGLKAEIITWNRALIRDMDCSLAIGSKRLHISLPVSDIMIQEKMRRSRSWILKQLEKAATYLSFEDVRFSVGAEDSTRAAPSFLLDYFLAAQELGAERIRLCDTIGIADPFRLADMVSSLKKVIGVDLEIHAHNDLGMATANALAGAKSGASVIDTTVIGLGERAGNTPLEEIIMALHLNMKIDTGIQLNQMVRLAETVSIAAGRPISRGKSIVGEEIFSHESGIHVDGIRKNPEIYEPYHPDLVGATRKFIIGKHSGPSAVFHRLQELGYHSGRGIPAEIIEKIRLMASNQKGGVSDDQLRFTMQDEYEHPPHVLE